MSVNLETLRAAMQAETPIKCFACGRKIGMTNQFEFDGAKHFCMGCQSTAKKKLKEEFGIRR